MIIWHWDCYQLTGLISSVLRNFHCVKSIRIRRPVLSVFSPYAGKYRPEKLRIKTLFTQCLSILASPSVKFSLQINGNTFQTCFQNLTKENELTNQTSRRARTRHYYDMPILLYYTVFLVSSYIFKTFLFGMFRKLTIASLELSLWFETAINFIFL